MNEIERNTEGNPKSTDMNAAPPPIVNGDDESSQIDELSAVDKIVGVFIAPVSTFKYLARRPDFWTVFIVMSLISIALAMVTLPKVMPMATASAIASVQKSLDSSPGTTEQEKAKAIGIVKKATEISTYIGSVVGTPIALAIAWVIMVAIVFFLSLMQGLDADFKRLLGVLPWVGFINLFTQGIKTWVIVTHQNLTMDQMQNMHIMMPLSLAGIIPESVNLPKFVSGMFGVIDPFFIWSVIIMIIAVQQATKSTKQQATITTLIYTFLSIVMVGGLAMLGTIKAG